MFLINSSAYVWIRLLLMPFVTSPFCPWRILPRKHFTPHPLRLRYVAVAVFLDTRSRLINQSPVFRGNISGRRGLALRKNTQTNHCLKYLLISRAYIFLIRSNKKHRFSSFYFTFTTKFAKRGTVCSLFFPLPRAQHSDLKMVWLNELKETIRSYCVWSL